MNFVSMNILLSLLAVDSLLFGATSAGLGAPANIYGCLHSPEMYIPGDALIIWGLGINENECMERGDRHWLTHPQYASTWGDYGHTACWGFGTEQFDPRGTCRERGLDSTVWSLDYGYSETNLRGDALIRWDKTSIELVSQSADSTDFQICGSPALCGKQRYDWNGEEETDVYFVFSDPTIWEGAPPGWRPPSLRPHPRPPQFIAQD